MGTTRDEFTPTRRTLLSRLKNWDDAESWRSFFDRYGKLIYRVARQSGLNDAESQDVVQETVITVAKKIPEFKYDPAIGSFKGWLMQITRWRVLNHIRKKHYESGGKRMLKEERLDTALLEVEADKGFHLEKLWDDEWRANFAEAALERLKKKVSARDYQIFYLHILKKVAATEVARRMDIKLAEVYFIKYKLSRIIQRERKALEKQYL